MKTVRFGNQPAFPSDKPVEFFPSGETKRTASGITVRDYFAVHAPERIPDWFEHIAPSKSLPPLPDPAALPDVVCDGRNSLRAWAAAWLRDPTFDLVTDEMLPDIRAAATAFEAEAKAHWDAKRAWSIANQFERLVQWRYVYADAMLEGRW
jgi:hypothetical protein